MHSIDLKLIKPSPNPVRKTWDEGKMDELAQSIKEQGVIVPIKVRPIMHPGWLEPGTSGVTDEMLQDDHLGDAFEIVYGHRRVEASRRAGLAEIPAIVETPDDTDALIQALIENVVREDMTPYDRALGLQELKSSSGWTDRQIADSLGWKSLTSVGNFLALLRPELAETQINKVEDAQILWQAQAGLGKEHLDALPDVINKAVDQELNRRETRAVADAYVKASTPELKAAVLETSGKLGDADRILQVAEMKVAGRNVETQREEQRERSFQEFDSAVKDFLDAIRMFDRMIDAATRAAKYGKFSPEAKPFTVRKIDKLIAELGALREELTND